jgi:two-component system chemotaxis response regulator CheY
MDNDQGASLPVLIVDDVVSARRVIKKQVQRLGFPLVYEANDGQLALSMLREQKFMMVISDMNMPSFSGLDLLNAMRSDDALKMIPFIMITSSATPDGVKAVASARLTEYIVKPFSSETLAQKIRGMSSR